MYYEETKFVAIFYYTYYS